MSSAAPKVPVTSLSYSVEVVVKAEGEEHGKDLEWRWERVSPIVGLGQAAVGSREDPWPGAIAVLLKGPGLAVLLLHTDTRVRRARRSKTNPPLFLHLPHLQWRVGSVP